ncbi:hypothetical protein OIE99_29480 [Streptomyces cellulosae]|nr:hypothetical protein OIE99_29480 [Streptomyces cellulosae]
MTREHGKAAEWKCACGCGRQATDWAYLGTDPAAKVDETGRLYSVSPDHYAPLAKTCHRRFDAWQAQRRTGVPIALVIAEGPALSPRLSIQTDARGLPDSRFALGN